MVGDEQEGLATRTLELIPEPVPVARIDFRGPKDEQALAGLVTSLHIAAAAGSLHEIDPGKPGVPEFGRRLYHLAPSRRRKASPTDPVAAAVWRKEMTAGLKTTDQLSELHALCRLGIERLNTSRFAGFVFDYDGTLCEPHARFEPLSTGIAKSLNKLLGQGAIVGIATGRGGSASERLREAVRREFWDNVLIGFYNGAVICSLRDELPPPSTPNADIVRLEGILNSSRHFRGCTFRTNRNQITISLPALEEPIVSVRAAISIVEHAGIHASVSCSGHSIDVIFGGARKTAVVDAVRKHAGAAGDAPVLRVGDKGCWPGNDTELLDDPFGLSVDEVSPSAETCWGLAPRGVVGVQATLYYLHRINWKHGVGLIHFE